MLLSLLGAFIGVAAEGRAQAAPSTLWAEPLLMPECMLQALFATETFAMGLNMPRATVVFTAMSKFDGEGTRYLSAPLPQTVAAALNSEQQ